jgi:hypothetical protein
MPNQEPSHDTAQEMASKNEGMLSRARPLRKPPSFRNIVQNYSGTNAEWLLARILGWHDRITPEREKDIDAILYLLEKIGYIPEDPETAAFIALIALVWARLPLAPDLSDNPQHLMTPAAIGDEFRKVAAQMEGLAARISSKSTASSTSSWTTSWTRSWKSFSTPWTQWGKRSTAC